MARQKQLFFSQQICKRQVNICMHTICTYIYYISVSTLYSPAAADIPREPVSIFDMQALSLYRQFRHQFLRRFEIRTLYRFP